MDRPAQHPPEVQPIYDALHQVLDPEVGVNIIDLGLVYEVGNDDGEVFVRMTMTTPSCPLGSLIRDEAEASISEAVPGVRSVHIDIVYDPPWTADRVSPEGRRQLGWA